MRQIRTDLALESRELHCGELSGVETAEESISGFSVTTVRILNEEAASALCKPIGEYITIELGALLRREENAFADAALLLADKLRGLLEIARDDNILVAGLGNRAITPDALGPIAADNVLVTRHLKSALPEDFAAFRCVSALQPGVTGTTGVESAELIRALCEKIRPAAVIAVDALASRRYERLCRTVQLSAAGITPGSGVGNSRAALNSASLGIPVIAVGVPTVVDSATLATDLLLDAGLSDKDADAILERLRGDPDSQMIVTPRDIDRSVHDVGKLVGYSINLALHDGLTVADVDMLI